MREDFQPEDPLPAMGLLLPLFTTAVWPYLDWVHVLLELRVALYAASVAAAALLFERRSPRRIVFSVCVAAPATLLAHASDMTMIAGVAALAGSFAVSFDFGRSSFWPDVLYRAARTLLAVSLAAVAFLLPLPRGPEGSLTAVFSTFAVSTYLPIAGMLAFDSLALSTLRRFTRP